MHEGDFSLLPWRGCAVCRKIAYRAPECGCYRGRKRWYEIRFVVCQAELPEYKNKPGRSRVAAMVRERIAAGRDPLLCGKIERYTYSGASRKYCSDCQRRLKTGSRVHWTVVAKHYQTLACWICEKQGGSPVDCDPHHADDNGWIGDLHPSVDHLVPRSVGGTDNIENLRLAHRGCNSRRQATPVDEILASARQES